MATTKGTASQIKQSKKKSSGVKTKNKKNRKKKYCARCTLHNCPEIEQTKEHTKICPYLNCPNFLCNYVIRYKQLAMKIQQDIWRKRNESIPPKKELKKETKEVLCDKCRNHLVRKKNKGHKKVCDYGTCDGILCRFTTARCKIMSFYTKIERNGVRCEVFQLYYEQYKSTQETNVSTPLSITNNAKGKRQQTKENATSFSEKCQKKIISPIPEYPSNLQYQHTSYILEDAPLYHSPNVVPYHRAFCYPRSFVWTDPIYFSIDPQSSPGKVAFESHVNPCKVLINYNDNLTGGHTDKSSYTDSYAPRSGNGSVIPYHSTVIRQAKYYRPWI